MAATDMEEDIPTATYYSTHFQINEGAQYKVYTFCSDSKDYFFMSDHKNLICFQSNSQNIENIALEDHTILGIETFPGKWIITYGSNEFNDYVILTIPDNEDVITYFNEVGNFIYDMHVRVSEGLAPRIRF